MVIEPVTKPQSKRELADRYEEELEKARQSLGREPTEAEKKALWDALL